MAKRSKPAPYTSSTLATSRKMIAPGPHHEAQAIIHDLASRARSLASSLPYYDRTTGKPIADEVAKLRAEAQRRIDQLPEGELRRNLSRDLWR